MNRLTPSAAALALNEAAVPYGAIAPASSLRPPASSIRHPDRAPSTTDSLNIEHCLHLAHASRHNLRDLSVAIPLGRFVAITGVSGSGKTTLVREVLLPALESHLKSQISNLKPQTPVKASDRLETSDPVDPPSETPDPGPRTQTPVSVTGWESLGQVVLVDQSPLGKTPRSNPVVYMGAFDDVRELFAQTDLARQRGLNSSAFSFNSGIGRCERCRGAGFEKIEMQFLSDIFIRCPECNGRRYRAHILEVKLRGTKPGKVPGESAPGKPSAAAARPQAARSRPAGPPDPELPAADHWSIADLLEATVDDALEFLSAHAGVPAGRRALARLKLLQEVGLGYLRLGQPINTLSGGESQRLKLVSHLAETAAAESAEPGAGRLEAKNTRQEVEGWLNQRRNRGLSLATGLSAANAGRDVDVGKPLQRLPSATLPDTGLKRGAPEGKSRGTLFIFDEPTTGLHFDDVRVLLQVFQRIVDAGHSVVVIEHNLDVIKCADWVIDLGPDAGERGGQLVIAGTPEDVAACEAGHTGRFLRDILQTRPADRPDPAPPGPGGSRLLTKSRA